MGLKYYVTGHHPGSLGEFLNKNLDTVDTLEECDIFINCRFNGFDQVRLLYKATDLGKRVINIGSISSDGFKRRSHVYSVHKAALDKANEQLFYSGKNTTILRFGWIDTSRVEYIKEPKMSKDYVLDIIKWVTYQPHRVKEITIDP
jgi:NADP-dependent 3-hydroxy acid dehydrogenase YdfG